MIEEKKLSRTFNHLELNESRTRTAKSITRDKPRVRKDAIGQLLWIRDNAVVHKNIAIRRAVRTRNLMACNENED